MPKLSICIPTYNRTECLDNCLNSILIAKKNYDFNFEVCISDNCSDTNVNKIIDKYKNLFEITFNRNSNNLGLGVNILKAVSLAKGEFVWILGNDDLLLPETFKHLKKIFENNSSVDFYYINSYHINSSVIFDDQQPYNTKNLPNNLNKYFTQKNLSRITHFMTKDKKNHTNKINLILLKKIGSPLFDKNFSEKKINLFLKKELTN